MQIESKKRNELIDITDKVSKHTHGDGVILFCPHTTAGICINEGADPDVKRDILNWLNDKVPEDSSYSHAEGNSDAHIKASIIGSSLVIPVIKGKPALGRWQSIFFCEFDGPRKRELIIKNI